MMLIRTRFTSSPATWVATNGPRSTGLKVSPSATAKASVSTGSPVRTSNHHPNADAPAEHARLAQVPEPVLAVSGPGHHEGGGQQREEDQEDRRDAFGVQAGEQPPSSRRR